MFDSDPWAELIEVDFGATSGPDPLKSIPSSSSSAASQLAWIKKVWDKLQATLSARGTLTDDSAYLDANNPAVAAGQLRAYMARYKAALGSTGYARFDKALATLQGNAVLSAGTRFSAKETASPAVNVLQASSSTLQQTTATSLVEAAEGTIPSTSTASDYEPAAVYDEMPIVGASVLTTVVVEAPPEDEAESMMDKATVMWEETPTWLKWLGGGAVLGAAVVGISRRL